jgi:hypothetical protein
MGSTAPRLMKAVDKEEEEEEVVVVVGMAG